MATQKEILERLDTAATNAENATDAYNEVLTSEGEQDIPLVDGTTTPNLNKRLKNYISAVKSVQGKTGDVVLTPSDLLSIGTKPLNATPSLDAVPELLDDNGTRDPAANAQAQALLNLVSYANNTKMRSVASIDELISIQNPPDGENVLVCSYHPDVFEGGGLFRYDEESKSINNGGTIINGWVRQYDGDVDIAFFGARQGEDAGPFIESALKVKKSIVIRGNYTLESIIGIPDQNNYSKEVTRITGENQATLTINCPSGAVFTSAAAKADPNNLANLYTGKIDISKINFVGTTTANSVLINGDRLYNLNIHHNNFQGSLTIIKAYLKREASRQYTQSCSINNNHLASVYRVIETDKAYNFDFSYNMCETCIGGMYIGVSAPYDPSAISLTIHRNLWEGGGLILKTNGGIIGGTISSNYFENNTFHDAATEKCLISINRSGAGAGYSSGIVVSGNLFSGNTSIADYTDVKYLNQSTETASNSKAALTKPPVFTGNWSSSYSITNHVSAVLIGNRCQNRATMRNAYSSQDGRVSFVSGYLEKPLSSILTGNILSLLNIDTRPSFDAEYICTNFKNTFDVNVFFKTAGGINTASCSFKMDVFVYTPFGASKPSKANLKAVMYGFMQSDTNDTIITGETMKSVITSAALTVTNNGDGTYTIKLGNFANSSSPNWGNIANARIEYTCAGTLISSHTGNYSTSNLLTVT